MTDEERAIVQEANRRVVCAANVSTYGVVLLGARHWDTWMRKQADAQGITGAEGCQVQGFIDQYGNFLTRSAAWVVAKRQNQIIRLVGSQKSIYDDDEKLWSENLY